jgi:hypothetical protein
MVPIESKILSPFTLKAGLQESSDVIISDKDISCLKKIWNFLKKTDAKINQINIKASVAQLAKNREERTLFRSAIKQWEALEEIRKAKWAVLQSRKSQWISRLDKSAYMEAYGFYPSQNPQLDWENFKKWESGTLFKTQKSANGSNHIITSMVELDEL